MAQRIGPGNRLGLAILVLGLAFTVGLDGAPVAAAPSEGPAMNAVPVTVPVAAKRVPGLEGLVRRSRGPCAGSYLVRTPAGGPTLCSPGPEAAPRGIASTTRRTIRELRRAVPRRVRQAAGQGPHGIPCVGDGEDGYRVQAIYARYADTAGRFASVAPLIRDYVPIMDQDIAASAAQSGGERHLRWVTNADCSLRIENVVIPAGAGIAGALEAHGFDSPRRKYHIWMDTHGGFSCGYGTIFDDNRPGSVNDNETNVGYAISFENCWFGEGTGLPSSVEIHEIWHTLGAVQASAPNATPNGHCTDEYDVMCYDDGSGLPMRSVCPVGQESLLDCGDDDYFDTSPPAGSYLRNHLDTADSVYLVGSLTDPPPTPQLLAAAGAATGIRVTWTDVPGEEGYRIECRRAGAFETCQGGILGGTTTRIAAGLSPYTQYDVRVCAIGAGGTACSDPASARTLPLTRTVDDRAKGFTRTGRGWKRQGTGYGGSSLWRDSNTSQRGSGTWSAKVPAGTYEVRVFIPKRHSDTWSARYLIVAATGNVRRTVAQGLQQGRWVSLGRHRFDGTATVKLGDRTGEGLTWDIAYDAVRFVPISLSAARK